MYFERLARLLFYVTVSIGAGGWGESLRKERLADERQPLSVTVMLVLTPCNLLAVTVLFEEPAVLICTVEE